MNQGGNPSQNPYGYGSNNFDTSYGVNNNQNISAEYNQNYNNGYGDPNNIYANNDYLPQQNNQNNVQYSPDMITKPSKQPLAHLQNGLEGQARKKFIAKVYSILALQFLITTGMCFASYYSYTLLMFQIENPWLMWTLLGVALVVQIVIFCCPAGRKHPINMILLTIFTLCESYMLSYICAIVAHYDGTEIVVVAAIMTFTLVTALTMYAIFTKTDFTIKWGIVIVLVVAMLMLGFFSIFMYSQFLNVLYCTLGIILFGIYLVIDTQMIIGGKRLQLSMDDYVVGALLLYIDIIQLFLYILALLGRR